MTFLHASSTHCTPSCPHGMCRVEHCTFRKLRWFSVYFLLARSEEGDCRRGSNVPAAERACPLLLCHRRVPQAISPGTGTVSVSFFNCGLSQPSQVNAEPLPTGWRATVSRAHPHATSVIATVHGRAGLKAEKSCSHKRARSPELMARYGWSLRGLGSREEGAMQQRSMA